MMPLPTFSVWLRGTMTIARRLFNRISPHQMQRNFLLTSWRVVIELVLLAQKAQVVQQQFSYFTATKLPTGQTPKLTYKVYFKLFLISLALKSYLSLLLLVLKAFSMICVEKPPAT